MNGPRLSDEENKDDMDGGGYAEMFFDEAIEDDEKVNRPVESGVGAADISYCYDENGYVSDWLEIATRIKIARHRRCEKCRFSSFSNSIIHVHHIDKDKTNNDLSNLQVLCAFCHGAAHGTVPLGKMSSGDRAELMAWHRPTKA